MANTKTRNRRARATKAALVLDAAGIARVVSFPSVVGGRELFAFDASSTRVRKLAEVAALFVNARECHPDRAARMLRQLTRKGKPVAQQPKRKRKGRVEAAPRQRPVRKPRTPDQEAKHAAMRARYQPQLAG